jgi:tetratricopeptide (TPR) repeat protein
MNGDRQRVAELAERVVEQCRTDPALAGRTAREALALAERSGDPESRALAWRALGNVCHVTDRNREALDHYRQAAEIFFALGLEVEGARTWSSQVMPLALLGECEQALAIGGQARAVFERHGEAARLARLEINCGNIYHRLDRFGEALASYDRALAGIDRQDDPEALAAILSNRATTLITLNRFREALECYEEARRFCAGRGMDMLVAQADYNIAYLYYLRGEYSRALEMLDQARARFAELDNAYHQALCDLDQSEICLELNQGPRAQSLAAKAGQRFRALGMGYEEAKSLANQAVASQMGGDLPRALDSFAQARALFAREKNQIWVRIVDLYRAVLHLRQGDLEEAARLARGLSAFFSQQGVPTKSVYARLVEAQVHMQAGRLRQSEACCRRAQEALETLEAPWLNFHCHAHFGRLGLAQDRRSAALEHYRLALEVLEQMRSHLHFDELRIAFLQDKLTAFENFVLLCLEEARQAQPERRAALEREAFQAIERAKARSLANILERAGAPRPGSHGPGLLESIRTLREELGVLYRRINLDEFAPRSYVHGEPAGLLRQIRESEQQLLQLVRQLPPEERFETLELQPPVALEEVQQALPPGAQLLEYYIAEGAVLACLVDAQGLRVFPSLTLCAQVERALRLWRFQMAKVAVPALRPFADRLADQARAHLQELHRMLIEPLEPWLSAGGHLVVAPHGFLHAAPFHAFYDGRRYLAERSTVSYAPSATLFRECLRRRPASPGESLILEVATAGMPYVVEEVERAERFLPAARVLRGAEAGLANLHRFGAQARFLHIAGHGLFRHDHPLFSAIQLGDGWMTLQDVYQLRLNSELVTLSGCATGVHQIMAGDELIGLVRGFLHAGAASLLVSLWDVSDEVTALLMGRFYRALREGCGRSLALQKAMTEVRGAHPHPCYWAPFVLVGQP